MTDADDEALLDRYLRDKDRQALAELFERYARRLYGLALAVLRDPSAAEDVVQQVFVRLLESRTTPEAGYFRAWLYRIATNETMQALRSGKRRQRREQDLMRERAGAPTPSDDLRRELEEGISGLDAPLQEVLRLRYHHGLAFQEVARVLDRPQGTVARQAHEAREQLRRRLAVTGLLAGLSLESALEAMELPLLPKGLVQRVVAKTAGPPALLAKLPIAAAILVPLAALFFAASLRSRTPARPAALLVRGEDASAAATATASEPAPTKERSPFLGSGDGTEGKLRVLEVQFRITLSPPGTSGTRVDVREVLDLETTMVGRVQVVARPETPGSTATYTTTLRCTRRTLYSVSAFDEGPSKGPSWPRRFVTVSPGDVSEIRLVRGEPSEESFHDVLFQALPGQKTFGAIRGRFAGAGKNWTVTVTGTDPLWKERTWTRTEGETFTILPALPGNHELRFSDLCCSIVLPVTVLPGETADLGTIAHSKRGGGAVRGRIINHAGRPAAGLTVTLWEDANAQDGRRASAVTDLDGRFEISGVDEAFRSPRMSIYTKEGGMPLQRRPVRIGELDLLLRLPEPDSKEENR